jgi:hypothetical protein
MEVNFKDLELLPKIYTLLQNSHSPYLTFKELQEYLKVKESYIKERMRTGEFETGVHYFKPSKGKILFDRASIDDWVRREENNGNQNQTKKNQDEVGNDTDDLSSFVQKWREKES